MKSTGLLIKERAYWGSVTPPTNFADESRWGNNGTSTGTTWTQLASGLWYQAYNDADNGTAITHNVNLNPDKFTIAAWVNGVAWTRAVNYIMSKESSGAGYELHVTSAGKPLAAQVRSDTSTQWTSNTVLSAATWYHLVVTIDTLTPAGYINGDLNTDNSNVTGVGTYTATTTNLFLGYGTIGAGRQLEGNIALFRLYNRVLSAGKIKQLFEAERKWFGV